MEIETYKRERIDEQIKYYSNKSAKYKKCNNILIVISIISSATIPVVTYFNSNLITATFGAISTITLSINSLFRFKEKSVLYRYKAEELKSQKYLYDMHVPPYDDDNASQLFVTNCEDIFEDEHKKWIKITDKENKA
ncbi:hypothetical protein AKUA1202_12540 [Apilactobacillus kunkeei]|nr:hypothetical protein AKUA1401_11730 [Apilactobacillus kunkeei]CAI2649805.1 hypothetical protein AKUH3B209X_12380 [Apilactobacillus kunkeei]CAI2691435.1 hypothetical protein AKUH4B505J_11890 [Apilactobacillus kunkeei]CAI2693046.1 hypothetical protein AKUA1202_12540 [Apilactobacillus kunkeei]